MKYLVMESAISYAVLLDEDGRFVKSANLGYEIGDTVTNPVLMLDKPLEKINGRSKITKQVIATVVAIAAMVMLVIGVNNYQQSVTPYSSIFMAINPEVEIVLNKSGDVIKVNGINADGLTLIEEYDRGNKNKTTVANDMVDRAIEMGYLADGGRVAIAIDTPDQALFEQYGAELRNGLSGRAGISISVTDMEHRNQEPEETLEPEIKTAPDSEVEATEENSSYNESSYEEPVVEEIEEPETPVPAPVPETRPAPTPVPAKPEPTPEPKPEPTPSPTPAPSRPETKPNPAPPSSPPSDQSDYDTDYDDTDYSDYDDSDYTDYDDSDYYDDRRPGKRNGKGNRNKNSHKDNGRNKNGHSTGRNSRNRD